MEIRKQLKTAVIVIAAMLMSIAPGLQMTVERKLRPDAHELWGMLYQLLGRTFNSLKTDPFTLGVLFCAFCFLAWRYLFHKPKNTGIGEYVLCGLMAVLMLVCAVIRTTWTVRTLYENMFQVAKAGIYLAGMFLIDLCLLRGLRELLQRKWLSAPNRLWDKQPFAFPGIVIAVLWLPHAIIKYPGVICMDTVMPIRQYIGLSQIATDFPPFGTLIYGWMFELGQKLGNVNLTYFAITLVQLAFMWLAVTYAMWLMKIHHAPKPILILSLLLFGITPNYIGWAMTIIKDSQYLAYIILLVDMLFEFFIDPDAFLKKKSRWALLLIVFILLILTRGNGAFIVVPCALSMVVALLLRKKRAGKVWGLIAVTVSSFIITSTTNACIVDALDMNDIHFYDYLSIPFQQTALVAKRHGTDVLSEQEKADVSLMIDYDRLADVYDPTCADGVKMTVDVNERGHHSPLPYLKVWWKQLKEYPLDYIDAFFSMNHYMFDLQNNVTVYFSYADITEFTQTYAFHETFFFNQEEIRPLLYAQLALTEWYKRFDHLPLIGQFTSMGFCTHVLVGMLYLAWVDKRRKALLIMIPALITAVSMLFCPIVYIRYYLPVMGTLPLWLAAYGVFANKPAACQLADTKE